MIMMFQYLGDHQKETIKSLKKITPVFLYS